MTDTVKAWHWLREDRRLQYGDGRVVEVGETLTVDVEPELCSAGLHASVWLLDSLRYAPGPVLCRVEVGGGVLYGDDKIVGTSRKALWIWDDDLWLWRATCRIGEWALEQELAAGREVPRSYAAIEARRAWLEGEDVDLGAAYSAAYSAARSAAHSAASSAAHSAARSAAYSAAYFAADSAAYFAAHSAASSAAYSAASSVIEDILLDELTQVVGEEMMR